ncbi:MAG: carbohydrate binding domain-containing protein [Ruminococcus sp.]|nr:carbohydrate binding domain-containing protein [Ruminococcus sp.]
MSAAADDTSSYLFHDTFEYGTDDWTARGSCTAAESSDEKYSGSKSLSLSGRSDAWNGGQKALDSSTFVPGKAYAFSACFATQKGSESTEFKLTLQYELNDEPNYAMIAQEYAKRGDFVQLYNPEFTIPTGAENLVLVVETTKSNCDFYVDEVIAAPAGTVISGPASKVVSGEGRMRGDVDLDGKITLADYVALKKAVLNGIKNGEARVNADVDKSGIIDDDDVTALHDYLNGTIAEFPDNTPQKPPKSEYIYNSAISFKEAPGDYFNSCQQAGTVTRETYNGINGSNSCLVYTPYGYDSSKKYNILYLMHGGGENETTIFQDKDAKMANMFDHMIMNGELEPLIVVCPTFNKCTAQTFYKEWMQSLIPFVESKYSTYAESTSEADIKASRFHRAYGGFSMGSCSTWAGMVHGGLDICAYWLPLSGDNWEADGGYGKAKSVADAIDRSGLQKNEYFIMCATGSEDIAYPNMNPQIDEMKKMSQFVYTSDFSEGNFYYLVAPGKTHWWGYVRHYVYDVLPSFFHEGE